MNYGLLVDILKCYPRDPATTILDDFVLPAGAQESWRVRLRDGIDSTLSSGGRVFVASHVFNPDSYTDLTRAGYAFSDQLNSRYKDIDGAALYREVREVLGPYTLKESELRVGSDNYFVIEGNQSGPSQELRGNLRTK